MTSSVSFFFSGTPNPVIDYSSLSSDIYEPEINAFYICRAEDTSSIKETFKNHNLCD